MWLSTKQYKHTGARNKMKKGIAMFFYNFKSFTYLQLNILYKCVLIPQK